MSSAPNPARRIVSLVMLLAAFALLPPGPVLANASGICRKWPQNSLAISPNLKKRRFVVEPMGGIKQLPPSLEPDARRVFQRLFKLSLDAAEPIGIYQTSSRRICVVARENDILPPIKMVVFFLGREGEASENVKAHAERVAFSHSSSLTNAEYFTDVRLHLKKGGSNFGDIKPFFICGVPGAVLCESSCPADLPGVVRPLIEWVYSGKSWPLETGESGQAQSKTKPVKPPKAAPSVKVPVPVKAPVQAEKRQECQQLADGGANAVAGPKSTNQAVASSQTAPKTGVQAPPVSSGGQKPPTESSPSSVAANKPSAQVPVPAAQKKKPVVEPQKTAVPEQEKPPKQTLPPEKAGTQKQQTAGGSTAQVKNQQPLMPPAPVTPSHGLVLAFERKDGTAVGVDEVLHAEGTVTINGTSAAHVGDSLVLSLPEDAAAEATKLPALKNALPHYEVSDVREEQARTVVTVKPRFSRVASLTVKIAGGRIENVSGCDLALDVLKDKRLGTGWSKNGTQKIPFREVKGAYAPVLPLNADRNGFLIDTGQDGSVALLLSLSEGCKLESRPSVLAQEVRGGLISRNLHEATRQILIALISTDSEFSNKVGAAAAEGFWAGALGLAGSVSEGAWEKKILGRAQSPGVSHETKMLDVIGSGKFAAGPRRDQILKELIEGSRQQAGYDLLGGGSTPIKRFELNMGISIIRSKASIVPREGLLRESLLLITGGVDPAGGYFCRWPVPLNPVAPAAGQWVSGMRRIFAVEVWSDAAAQEFEKAARATPAEGAPAGIYACNFPAHEATTVLYGVLPQALAPGAKDGTFAYLTGRANSFLRP